MPIKVEKEEYRITIIMDSMRVIGNIHATPRTRLTDILNSSQIKDFIPVTDAEVEIYTTGEKKFIDLIEINKNKINAIYPSEDNI